MDELVELCFGGVDYPPVAVAAIRHRDAGEAVEVFLSVLGEQNGPVAMVVMLAPPAEEAVVAEAPTEEEGVSVEASPQVAKPSFAAIRIISS